MPEVSEAHLRLVVYVVSEELDRRRRFGHPVPLALRDLETALTQAMSANGHLARRIGSHPSRLKTTAELATEWQCSTRTARRRAAAAGAEKVGGRWIFEQRRDDR